VIERAVILTKSNKITPRDINLDTIKETQDDGHKQKIINSLTLQEIEKEVILERLVRNHWNKGITASELGISTATLWRKIKQFNLSS
jgi:two-component system response regulator HydG